MRSCFRRDAPDCAPFAPQTDEAGHARQMSPNCYPDQQQRAAFLLAEAGGCAAANEHPAHVPRIPRHRDEGGSDQHYGREILGDHEQPVALDEVRFERRGSSRRVRIVMIHHGISHINALPPGPARAQAEIRILAIQEKCFVEQTHFAQDAAPQRHRWRADPISLQ